MERNSKFAEKLDSKTSLIYIVGQESLKIQNYKKILQYTQKEMVILLDQKILHVKGENLNIDYFNEDEMCICGHIKSITYQGG